MTNLQVEEHLAEEFRDYMLGFESKEDLSGIKKFLFELIESIKNLFNDKPKIFNEIRKGKYAYAQTHSATSQVFASEVEMPGMYKKEFVDAISFYAVKNANLVGSKSSKSSAITPAHWDLSKSNLAFKAKEMSRLYKEESDSSKKEELKEVLGLYRQVFNNWDLFVNESIAKVESFGLETSLYDEDYNEDDFESGQVDGEEFDKNAVNQDVVSKATANTKLMIATLRDPNEDTNLGLPKMADVTKSWATLKKELSGIVSNLGEDTTERMKLKVGKLVEDNPQFKDLFDFLNDGNEETRFKKQQFYITMSGQSLDYINTIMSKTYDTEGKQLGYEGSIGNADIQSISNQLKQDAISNFRDNIKTKGFKQSVIRLKNIVSTIDTGTGNRKPAKYKNIEDVNQEELAEVLQDLGFPIKNVNGKPDVQAVGDYLKRFKTPQSAMSNLFNITVKAKDKKTLEGALSENEFDLESNFITENAGYTNALFRSLAYRSDINGGRMVLGPDGKMFFTESLNNFATKTVALWKSDVQENEKPEGLVALEKLKSKSYHEGSSFIKEIMKDPQSFKLEAYLMQKIEGTDDAGRKYSEIAPTDDVVERINRTLIGVATNNDSTLFPLTLADKSMAYTMTGKNLVKGFEVKRSQDGSLDIGDNAVSAFKSYFEAEANRIKKMSSLDGESNKKYINDVFNSNPDSNKNKALKSFWFPSLNPTKENIENGLWSQNEDGSLTYDKEHSKIEQAIKEALSKEIESEIENLKNRNIISSDDTVTGVFESTKKFYSNQNYNNKEQANTEMVADYVINSMIGNIEYTMLFTGDPAFYKDLPKRTAATIATGTDVIPFLAEDKQFKIAVLKDIEGDEKNPSSDLYKEYLKTYSKKYGEKKAKKILKPYAENNQADALAYITPSRFKSILRMEGKLDENLDSAISRLMQDEYPDSQEQMFKDMNLMMGYEENPSTGKLEKMAGTVTAQSMKGMHFQLRDHKGFAVPTYLKYSQAVLWPALVKGTNLGKLYNNMNKSGVDEAIFESGVKSGNGEVSDARGLLDGSVEEEDFFFSEITTLDNFYWKRQQDLPTKYFKKEAIQRGSQAPNNLIANIIGKMIKLRGVDSTEGADVAMHFQSVEAAISNLGLHGFKSKMNSLDKTELQSLAEDLLEDAIAKEADENTISQLQGVVSGRIKAPLEVIASGGKLEQELLSRLTKATVKLPVKGGAFIQMSNAGFKNPGVMTSKDVANMQGIIYFNEGKELQGPRKVNGKTVPGDIFLPYKFFEMLPAHKQEALKNGEMKVEELKEMLGDSIEGLIGFRIPNQAMSSNDVLNVAGILPGYVGDNVVTYTEITGKTGSDFDIDKMFVMTPHLKWNGKKLEKIKYDTDESNYEARFNSKKSEVVRMSKPFKELKRLIDNAVSRDNTREFELNNILLNNELTDSTIQAIIDYNFLQNEEQKTEDEIRERISSLKNNIEEEVDLYLKNNDAETLEKFANKPLEFQNSRIQLENRRLEASEAILMADDTFIELTSPLDSEDLAIDSYYLAFLHDLSKGEVSISDYNKWSETEETLDTISSKKKNVMKFMKDREANMGDLQFASPRHQLRIKAQNMSGKAGIGQTANHMTHISQAQLAGLKSSFDLGIGVVDKDGKTRYDIAYFNNKEKDGLITMGMSAWLNAYVDNAKDPYITLINNNVKTANSVFAMLRAGTPIEIVNRIVTQPIVRDYVENLLENDSKIIGAETIDSAYNIPTYDSKKDAFVNRKVTNGFVTPLAKTLRKYTDITESFEDSKLETADLRSMSVSDLDKNIALGEEADPDVQLAILNSFIKIMGQSAVLNDVVKASKQNTRGSYQSAGENIVARELYDEVTKEGFPMENVNNLFRIDGKETFLGAATNNSMLQSENLFKDKMMSFSPGMRSLVQKVHELIGQDVKDSSLVRKITSAYKTFSVANTKMFSENNYKDLFYGENNMAERIQSLKKSGDFDNSFLSSLRIKFGKESSDPSFIQLPSSKQRTKYETDDLIKGWREMLTSENPVVSKIGKDLINYSFFSSGMSKNLNSFYDLIPAEVYEEVSSEEEMNYYEEMSEVHKNLNGPYDASSEDFVDRFIRHNAGDDKLVPKITKNNSDVISDGLKKKLSLETLKANSKFNKGTTSDPSPVGYIGQRVKGNVSIYKFTGQDGKGDFIYEEVSELGFKEKGNYIYEYNSSVSKIRENPPNTKETGKSSDPKVDLPGDLGRLEVSSNDKVARFTGRPTLVVQAYEKIKENGESGYGVRLIEGAKIIDLTSGESGKVYSDINEAHQAALSSSAEVLINQILDSCK